MKILHAADLHLDTPFTGYDPTQARYLREQLLTLPQRLATLCRKEQCDLVLLAGDLFDGPCSQESVRTLAAALEECAVPVFISPGNHDYVSLNSPYTTALWPSNVHIFKHPVMESVYLEALDCRVYGAGYRCMDCGSLLEGFHAGSEARYHIGILHGDPTRGDSPCCPVTAAQILGSGLDYLALGHIHKAGSVRQGKTLCAWPGCPMGRGFDETGDKGVFIVTLEEDARADFIALDVPRFLELKTDDPEQVLPALGNEDFYRITLTGTDNGIPIETLRRRFSHFPNLQFIDGRTPDLPLWEDIHKDTLEGAYFRNLKDALEKADEEDQAIVNLAARISRQILDGQEVALP